MSTPEGDYTPTTDTARDCYVYGRWATGMPERHLPEFDRWLAAHDAATRVAALEEAEKIALSMVDNEPDGYYGQACIEVAAAFRAAKQETP